MNESAVLTGARPKVPRLHYWLLPALLLDLAFMAGHLFFADTPFYDEDFSLQMDRALPEMFQYLKLVVIVGLAWVAYQRWHDVAFRAIALVMAYCLMDDVLKLHERGGRFLTLLWGIDEFMGIRAIHLGELVMMVVPAVVMAGLVVLAYRQTQDAESKRMLAVFFVLCMVLGGCAAGIDAVHSYLVEATDTGAFVLRLFTVLEDGGEMLAVTGVMALTIRHWRREFAIAPIGRLTWTQTSEARRVA